MIRIRCLHLGKWTPFFVPHTFPSFTLIQNWNCTGHVENPRCGKYFLVKTTSTRVRYCKDCLLQPRHSGSLQKKEKRKRRQIKNPLVKVFTSTRGFLFIFFFHSIWHRIFSYHHNWRRRKIIFDRLMFGQCFCSCRNQRLSQYCFYTFSKRHFLF